MRKSYAKKHPDFLYSLQQASIEHAPEMSGIDLSNNESGVVPGRSGKSREQTEHDHHYRLIMHNVEQKHRNGRDEQTECCREKLHNILQEHNVTPREVS